MKTNPFYLTLVLGLFVAIGYSQEKKKGPAMAVKFMKHKLEQVGLTDEQWDAFDALSAKYTQELRALHAETGMGAIMKERDSVYSKIKKEGIPEGQRLAELDKRMNLTQEQLRGFKEAPVLKDIYKNKILEHLTETQKVRFRKAKGMKKTK